MSDFLDLAAARASGELKGTASSSKVISGLEMSTRSGLEVVVLMSVGIVAVLSCFLLGHQACNVSVAPPTVLPEYKLWEDHWCHCSHELGQWYTLNDFVKAQNGASPFLGKFNQYM